MYNIDLPKTAEPNPQWSQDQGIAYEVACDLVNDVTATVSEFIYAEEKKPNPDLDTIICLDAQISYYFDARDKLEVTDDAAVKKLQEECRRFLASCHEANMPSSDLNWGEKLAAAVRHLSKNPSALEKVEKRAF